MDWSTAVSPGHRHSSEYMSFSQPHEGERIISAISDRFLGMVENRIANHITSLPVSSASLALGLSLTESLLKILMFLADTTQTPAKGSIVEEAT